MKVNYGKESEDEDFPSEAELNFWKAEPVDIRIPTSNFVVRENSFDLGERTARFGEDIIRFAKSIQISSVTNRLIDQLVGAGTSIGANYCEANDYISKKDFKYRISICRKEAKETCFFLRMIVAADATKRDEARLLWKEASELNLIFGSIWRKC